MTYVCSFQNSELPIIKTSIQRHILCILQTKTVEIFFYTEHADLAEDTLNDTLCLPSHFAALNFSLNSKLKELQLCDKWQICRQKAALSVSVFDILRRLWIFNKKHLSSLAKHAKLKTPLPCMVQRMSDFSRRPPPPPPFPRKTTWVVPKLMPITEVARPYFILW